MTAQDCGTPTSWLDRLLSRLKQLRLLRIGLMVIVPATLPALAYASPPDPSWIQGLYDDADDDDIVVLAVSGSAAEAPGTVDAKPIHRLIACLSDRDGHPPLSLAIFAVHPRAPPQGSRAPV